MSNHGELTVTIWPPYIGLSTVTGEPIGDPNYTRGLITWRTEPDGEILGSAHVYLPKGVYHEIVFYSGPDGEHPPMGDRQALEQPVVFDRPGMIEINPIQCGTYLPRQ